MSLENTIINNILCYVSSARHILSKNDIVSICIAFYGIKSIQEAKDLIFKVIGEQPKRRRTEDRIKVELQDIFDAFQKSDDEGKSLPLFVASGMNAMPPSTGFEIISANIVPLMDEIAALKEEISFMRNSNDRDVRALEDYIDIKEELADIKKMLHCVDIIPKADINSISYNAVVASVDDVSSVADAASSADIASGPDVASGADVAPGADAAVCAETTKKKAPQKAYSAAARSGISRTSKGAKTKVEPRVIGESHDHHVSTFRIGKSGDEVLLEQCRALERCTSERSNSASAVPSPEDVGEARADGGWQRVGRRKRKADIVGRKKTLGQGLRGAPRFSFIYIGGCDIGTSINQIIEYCKNEVLVDAYECVKPE